MIRDAERRGFIGVLHLRSSSCLNGDAFAAAQCVSTEAEAPPACDGLAGLLTTALQSRGLR
jgi:hypothetical protein